MENNPADSRQTVTVTVPEALQMRFREFAFPWEWLNNPEFWEGVLETGVAAREQEQQEFEKMLTLLEDFREQEK